MKKNTTILIFVFLTIIGIVLLKNSSGVAPFVWELSRGGVWLFPLVVISAILDSVHPCSFSILLITIAFLFGMQMTRRKILQIGSTYIAGIFVAYLLIGLGILRALHLFNTPHFMGKLGAIVLVIFGILNILNDKIPKFPIKLRVPSVSHATMGKLMEKASFPAVFGLGLLVGICQFPCMGGPYLMIIGLLRDYVTYFSGFGYLVFYNVILISPLVIVLWIAADEHIVGKIQEWKKTNMHGVRLWTGVAMIAIGATIFFV